MRIILLLFLINFLSCNNKAVCKECITHQIICTEQDSILFFKKTKELKNNKHESVSSLIADVGRSFIGSPYIGKTLETGNTESLVINLREFDCTTLLESSLAYTLTLKSDDKSFAHFISILKNIRYRDGNLNGYESRLHYFSDWITDNQKKGIINDVTKSLKGIPYIKPVNFMSLHPDLYIQLKNDSDMIEKIRQIENIISERNYYYIPKEEIVKIEPQLEEGMIVAITSSVNGLDIAHTGILVKENGQIHLLHASSDVGKVTISEKTFVEYISGNKKQTGVMLLKVN